MTGCQEYRKQGPVKIQTSTEAEPDHSAVERANARNISSIFLAGPWWIDNAASGAIFKTLSER
jgi:hypothetical protein